MKKNTFIITALLIGGLCLTGCENEDITGLGNIEGAGTEIPEGYGLVNFPTDGMQTRAAANGQRAIAYVDLLLYEKQADETFKLYKKENKYTESSVGGGSTWPLSIAPETLPVGKTYKAVFLGNVNDNYSNGAVALEGVSGNAAFEEALIKKLENKEFSESNIPYIFVKEFTVQAGENKVPVMLKRIVSRHIIAGASVSDLPNGSSDKTYTDGYYEGLLADGQPLGNQIFGSNEGEDVPKEQKSLLWNCFFNQLMRDFIFPTAYMLKENGIWNNQTALATWWTENESAFWDNYSTKYPDGSISVLKQALKTADGLYEWKQNDAKSAALLQLVCDMFDNKNACIDKMLALVKKNNIPELKGNSASGQTGSYSLAVTSVAKQLQQNLPSSVLFPWGTSASATITLTKEPSALDFNLTVKEWNDNIQKKKIDLSGGDKTEKTLNLLLLGAAQPSAEDVFGFSSLYKETENDLTLPTDFPGQSLSANVSTTYRVTPSVMPQWDGTSTTDSDNLIYLSYGKITEILTNDGGITSLKYEDLIESKQYPTALTPFRFAIINVYYIKNGYDTAFSLTANTGYEYGKISQDETQGQFNFKMPIPAFTGSADTKWTYKSSKSV